MGPTLTTSSKMSYLVRSRTSKEQTNQVLCVVRGRGPHDINLIERATMAATCLSDLPPQNPTTTHRLKKHKGELHVEEGIYFNFG